MNKAENSITGLVFPSDDSSQEEISAIKENLQEAGFSPEDSEWLVDLFKRSQTFIDPSGESLFKEEFTFQLDNFLSSLEEEIDDSYPSATERQMRLVFLFNLLLRHDPFYTTEIRPNKADEESNTCSTPPDWIIEFQKHATFCVHNLDLQQLSNSNSPTFKFIDLIPLLFPNGIPLNQVVNLNRLDPNMRRSRSSNDKIDLEQLEFWLIYRFEDNQNRCNFIKLETLLPDFKDFSDNVLGEKIHGLINAIDYAMWRGSVSKPWKERLDPLNDGWQAVADELIPFIELFDDKNPESIQEPSLLLKAWWHLARHIYSCSMGGLEAKLSDNLSNKLVESASRHIGILRSVLRDTPEVFENKEVSDFYDKAFYILLCFAPAWKRIKPLLLAFTGMTKQAVANDLRSWRERDSKDDPPKYYWRVANWIEVAMYPQNLQTELVEDPYLQELRENFAKFCLERLRTKDKDTECKNDDFVEPRPAWRQCYVQALKALRINPGGRAHRTLFWLLNNDPDEKVRELAKVAHKQVRHLDRNKPNLEQGTSPRRPLFEAFWWFRQAHLITLGIGIDPAGAMRTRRKELHRTREKDDHFNRKE